MKNGAWIMLIIILLILMTVTDSLYPMMPQQLEVIHSRRTSREIKEDACLTYYLRIFSPGLPAQLLPYIRNRFDLEKAVNPSDMRSLIKELESQMNADSPSSTGSALSNEAHNYMYEIIGDATSEMMDEFKKNTAMALARKEMQIIQHREEIELGIRKARLNACTTIATTLVASAGTAIVTLLVSGC